MTAEIFGIPYLKKGSGIHIKKKNRGKFTEYCGGKVTDECILRAKKSKNLKLRKRATFAANARKWKHEKGGILKYLWGTQENGINLLPGFSRRGPDPNLYYHPDLAASDPRIAEINKAHDLKMARYDYAPEKLAGFTDGLHLRILEARRHLINKGLNDNLIYALFGNIMKESSFNPNAVLQGGDNAVGYFLMHGDRLNDFNRWKKQQKQLSAFPEIDYFLDIINSGNDIYTNGYNTSKNNVTNSYNALLDSIKNNKGVALATNEYNKYKKYHDDVYGHRENNNTLYLIDDFLKAWNDPNSSTEELTNLFEKTFEKAGSPETDKRIGYATTFLQHYTPLSMKKGNKIHKPFGHRSILDNGWLSTKLLKNLKNVYGL